ncbi:metal-dependent hydrolase [Pontibacter cellulosilyticus]|uniref:Metal-dependent hydrolase n=1 Tax=Pontibacter cellulosilyticus TaxID=1720253 RepID=A0A923SJ01_9BACT|nr:metal-dependent hydrolase [Pontibacter cellulosilyticus]MBC5993142.1 metal-dependent hydrolase [Pontibacter cellulosilyticus]
MASAFAHALAAVAIGKTLPAKSTSAKFWILGALCTILPDADVLMFKLGIPYEHVLGHRGFSHSLVFALLLGVLVTAIFFRSIKLTSKQGLLLILFFSLCTASHILLDALTNGGLGVAVFAPFDNTRHFLPWRPIQVSPIGIGNFFSEWGWRVIKSEVVWVGLPSLVYILFISIFKLSKNRTTFIKH